MNHKKFALTIFSFLLILLQQPHLHAEEDCKEQTTSYQRALNADSKCKSSKDSRACAKTSSNKALREAAIALDLCTAKGSGCSAAASELQGIEGLVRSACPNAGADLASCQNMAQNCQGFSTSSCSDNPAAAKQCTSDAKLSDELRKTKKDLRDAQKGARREAGEQSDGLVKAAEKAAEALKERNKTIQEANKKVNEALTAMSEKITDSNKEQQPLLASMQQARTDSRKNEAAIQEKMLALKQSVAQMERTARTSCRDSARKQIVDCLTKGHSSNPSEADSAPAQCQRRFKNIGGASAARRMSQALEEQFFQDCFYSASTQEAIKESKTNVSESLQLAQQQMEIETQNLQGVLQGIQGQMGVEEQKKANAQLEAARISAEAAQEEADAESQLQMDRIAAAANAVSGGGDKGDDSQDAQDDVDEAKDKVEEIKQCQAALSGSGDNLATLMNQLKAAQQRCQTSCKGDSTSQCESSFSSTTSGTPSDAAPAKK